MCTARRNGILSFAQDFVLITRTLPLITIAPEARF
jgi:hypothetical protein